MLSELFGLMLLLECFILILLGIPIPTPVVHGVQRGYTINLTSYSHEYSREFFKVNTLRLVNFSDHRAINGTLQSARDVDEFDVVLTVTMIDRPNQERTLFNLKTSGCKLLGGGPMKVNMLSVMWTVFKSTLLKLPDKCPVKKDTEIIVNKLYFDSRIGPQYAPPMKWNATFSLVSRHVDILKCFATIQIVPKRN